jgi:hypothetical protein
MVPPDRPPRPPESPDLNDSPVPGGDLTPFEHGVNLVVAAVLVALGLYACVTPL